MPSGEPQSISSLNCIDVRPRFRSQTGYETISPFVQIGELRKWKDFCHNYVSDGGANRCDARNSGARGGQATPAPRSRRIGTNRNLGANPTSASTSSAAHSSCNSVSGTPSKTLTTQSRHPGPRTAQSSQSITTGASGPGAATPLRSGLPSGRPLCAIRIGPLGRARSRFTNANRSHRHVSLQIRAATVVGAGV